MFKKLKLSALAVCMVFVSALVLSVFRGGVASAFTGGGAGTMGDPYQIGTCTQLQEMNDELGAHYVLLNNIDCSATSGWNGGEGFEPVGVDFSTNFTGSLDGNDRTISNLFINRASTYNVGLFGYLGNGSSVSDLTLQNVDILGVRDVGGLAGRSYGDITNVHVSGSVTAEEAAGGLISEQYGTVTDSSSTATITAEGETGGLVGYSSVDIIRSYATGDVVAIGYDYTGGLVGYQDGSEIVDSYATGNVDGEWGVGGLVGYSENGAQITRSYSTGAVTGTDPSAVGGLVGYDDGVTVADSFWDTQTSGQATSAGGTGKTTAEMKAMATFTDGNFDIQTTSTNRNSGYPFLSWEVGDTTPIWYIYVAPPTDGDGIDDSVEDAAPNGGDGNNDGTIDSQQANVVSFVDSVNSNYVTLEVNSACTLTAASSSAETSNTAADSEFSYPAGLLGFTADCGTPGFTTTVTQYYHGVTNSGFVLRKYNPTTKAYATISNAVLSQVAIGSQTVAKASYDVTDGGSLDTDGTADGVIIDPAGLAVAGLANTGQNIMLYSLLAVLLIVASAGTVVWRKKHSIML